MAAIHREEHPAPQQLTGLVLGLLPENEVEPLSDHVEQCSACEATVQRLEDQTDPVVDRLRQPPQHDSYEAEAACQQMLNGIASLAADRQRPSDSAAADATGSGWKLEPIREYEILEKLGAGGMGTVYKACHTKLNRLVALKVLPVDRMQDRSAVARFEREMAAVGALSHPNIVAATDAGEVDGVHYLVMELVEGVDLSSLVKKTGPLPPAAACELVRQAAIGLQHAHERGLVHRDIKPSNLMLAVSDQTAKRGREPFVHSTQRAVPAKGSRPLFAGLPLLAGQSAIVKILDMGLALLDDAHRPSGGELTSTGQIMGTFDYMAPEQADESHTVDIRADIYSLGAVLYKLLCGRAPLADEKHDTLVKKMVALATKVPPSIAIRRPDLPPQLVAVIDRMLAKLPEHRFATPRQVADALAPFADVDELSRLSAIAGADRSGTDALAGNVSTPSDSKSLETAALAGASLRKLSQGESTKATEGKAIERPQVTSVQDGMSRRKTAIAAALGGIALLAAALTFTFKNGTVIVEGQAGARLPDDVVVTLKSAAQSVKITSKDNWTIKASPGQYQVELEGGNDHFQVKDGTLTVSRFGHTLLSVSRKANHDQPVVAKPPGAKPLSDREIVKWVLNIGGGVWLQVGEKKVSPKSVADVPTEDFAITSVTLGGKKLENANDLQRLAGLKDLTSLKVTQDSPEGTNWRFLATLTSLERITAEYNREFNDEALRHLSSLPNLQELHIRQAGVTDAGLSHLPSSLTMVNLFLIHITDEGLRNLPDLPNMESLPLRATDVSDDGLAEVVRACPNLFFLDLAETSIGDAELQVLGQLRLLQGISVRNSKVTEQGIAVLKEVLPPPCKISWEGFSEPEQAGSTTIEVTANLRDEIELDVPVYSVRFSPDDRLLAASGENDTLRFFDTDDFTKSRDVSLPNGESHVSAIRFAPNGKQLLVEHDRAEFELVDVAEAKFLRHIGGTHDAAWSPDGTMLAIGSEADTFAVLDTGSWRPQLKLPHQAVHCLSFTPDGRTLISSGSGERKHWSMPDGKLRKTMPHGDRVAIASDGRLAIARDHRLAIPTRRGIITFWDQDSPKPFGYARALPDVAALRFSPDGRLVAMGYNESSEVVLAEVATGLSVANLQHPDKGISSVAFSKDGRTLATACADGKVRLWDIELKEVGASQATPAPDEAGEVRKF